MKHLFFIAVLFASSMAVFSACKKDKSTPPDTLIFGRHYGMCAGDCFEVYALTSTQLQSDAHVQVITDYRNYQFGNATTLPAADFNAHLHLLNEIPSELLTQNNVVFGSPDSHDQGGIYVQIIKNGSTHTFDIDEDDTNDQTQAVRDFKTKLNTALNALAY